MTLAQPGLQPPNLGYAEKYGATQVTIKWHNLGYHHVRPGLRQVRFDVLGFNQLGLGLGLGLGL